MFFHDFLIWQALGYTASSLLVFALLFNVCNDYRYLFAEKRNALFAQTFVAKRKRFDSVWPASACILWVSRGHGQRSPRSMAVQASLPVWRTYWPLARQDGGMTLLYAATPLEGLANHNELYSYTWRTLKNPQDLEVFFFKRTSAAVHDFASRQEWQCGGVPITSLCVIERRKGKASLQIRMKQDKQIPFCEHKQDQIRHHIVST